MTVVKIVSNHQTGKTILPSYFPLGVFVSRFGEASRVTELVRKLSDIDNYLVLEDSKLVIKPIREVDKQSFLTSFIMRIEDQLERTNDFTADYEIYPSDIVFESELKPVIKATTSQIEDKKIPDTVEGIFSDIKTEPIDLYVASKSLTSAQEEVVLKTSINHYLIAFGLKPIDDDSNQYPLHFLSTKGDALLNYALLDYFTNRKALSQLVTNESMKLALGRMGFYEFLEADSHLAGTFFEVVYACAMLQNEHSIRKRMEQTLVGEEAFKNKLPTLKFKDK